MVKENISNTVLSVAQSHIRPSHAHNSGVNIQTRPNKMTATTFHEVQSN